MFHMLITDFRNSFLGEDMVPKTSGHKLPLHQMHDKNAVVVNAGHSPPGLLVAPTGQTLITTKHQNRRGSRASEKRTNTKKKKRRR